MNDRTRIWLARVLFVAGVIPLVAIASVSIRSCRLERDTRSAAESRRSTAWPERAARTRAQAAATGRVGHLEIERLGLKAAIVEGVDPEELLVGVGHVPGTAYPGEPDNAALAGHRDTHLASLRHVARGDRIRVDTADGVFVYDVDSSFVVRPDRGDLLRPTGHAMLTLVTCYPFHWIGPAPKRFIVQAHAVETSPGVDKPASPSHIFGSSLALRKARDLDRLGRPSGSGGLGPSTEVAPKRR